MKRVEIIVEGQTEREFVANVLAPYFQANGISLVSAICIRTSQTGRGGNINYEYLKNDILRSLASHDTNLIVSMFVDYFRLPMKRIPNYEVWKDESNHFKQVQLIEQSIKDDIGNRRFIPYIQMHEFEALLFSSLKGFSKYWDDRCLLEMQNIMNQFPNPEDINTSPQGAPSKRILSIKPDYQKVLDGNIIALENGIDTIIQSCPRFGTWLQQIIQKSHEA